MLLMYEILKICRRSKVNVSMLTPFYLHNKNIGFMLILCGFAYIDLYYCMFQHIPGTNFYHLYGTVRSMCQYRVQSYQTSVKLKLLYRLEYKCKSKTN